MSRFQLRKLRELFAPLVQIVTFVVISSLVMSLVVLILALLLRSSRTDTNLMVAVMALLPQTVIDGITLGLSLIHISEPTRPY